MKKLFHEVAMQPEAILRHDAVTLLREMCLDHSRYVQNLPDDWVKLAKFFLIESNPDDRHKKLASLDKFKNSVIKTRLTSNLVHLNHYKNWNELISTISQTNPFDLHIGRKEIIYNGNIIDLDGYLDDSDKELGSIYKSFNSTSEWYEVINPIIHSDNAIAIVDRFFDLSIHFYNKLFIELIQWLKKTRVVYIRIFIGPKSVDEIRNNYWKSDFIKFCDQVHLILSKHAPELNCNIIVSSCQELHLRYFGSKTCALELDYGFRLSGSKKYKIAVMRPSALHEFKNQFFSQISGPNYLASKSVWPA